MEHNAKLAILTNVLYIDSGIKFFLDILEESGDFDSYQKWKRNVKYLKDITYSDVLILFALIIVPVRMSGRL